MTTSLCHGTNNNENTYTARLVGSDAAVNSTDLSDGPDSDDGGCFSNDTASECSDSKDHQQQSDSDSKPSHSYIGLIAMAILSSPEKKMVLGDIYNFISARHPFYKSQDKSWRNSIRHNLSLNECFIKAGRSEKGKGNYWSIHPANIEDFAKGDYRRRRSRKKVRRGFNDYGLFTNGVPHVRPMPYPSFPMRYHHLSYSESSPPLHDTKQLVTPPKKNKVKSFDIESILKKDDEKIPTTRYKNIHGIMTAPRISSHEQRTCYRSPGIGNGIFGHGEIRPVTYFDPWMQAKRSSPANYAPLSYPKHCK